MKHSHTRDERAGVDMLYFESSAECKQAYLVFDAWVVHNCAINVAEADFTHFGAGGGNSLSLNSVRDVLRGMVCRP